MSTTHTEMLQLTQLNSGPTDMEDMGLINGDSLMLLLTQLNNCPTSIEDIGLINRYTEKIFVTLYCLRQELHQFSDDERRIVGPLLQTALPRLNVKLYHEKFSSAWSYKFACAIRSGLQYLLDDYASFPTPDGILQEALTPWVQEFNLKEYDDCFRHHQPNGFSHIPDLYSDIKRVPHSHWWWRRDLASERERVEI